MAISLRDALKFACPVDSGALKESITIIQFTGDSFVIQIGNESGTEENDNTPTNIYASITNQRYLKYRVKGSYLMKLVPNKNYHWVNDAVDKWITDNKFNFQTSVDEEEEDDEFQI